MKKPLTQNNQSQALGGPLPGNNCLLCGPSWRRQFPHLHIGLIQTTAAQSPDH
jgi:hypothetical protein